MKKKEVFLIRFSRSKPGSFALAFKASTGVNHILIHSDKPKGFRIFEQDSNTTRDFPSLSAIIESYNYLLTIPFNSSLPKERWFQGDLSGDEAVEMLTDQEIGTFMVRFSSLGDLAASFVDQDKTVKHCLLTRANKQYQVAISTEEALVFDNAKDVVDYFIRAGAFIQPYKNLSSIFVEERPARDTKRSLANYSPMKETTF